MECGGYVEGEYDYSGTCDYCRNTKTTFQGECYKCGQHIGFSYCAHSHPAEGVDPKAHYIRTFTNSDYGYSGSDTTFRVYALTVTASSGITYSVRVSGATETDYVLPGNTVNIKFSNAPSGYNIKVSSSLGQCVIESDVTYRFVMPESALTIQASATTEVAPIYIGTTNRGPTYTEYYYNSIGNYFSVNGGTYKPSASAPVNVHETGGFISKSVSGTIKVNDGELLNCNNFTESDASGGGVSAAYSNKYAGGKKYYGSFIDFATEKTNTVNFTPSATDVVNGVRIGYTNDFGNISSFTTVTSTSTITLNCKWFVIFLPGDLVEGIDNLVIKVLPTVSAAEYNATLSTVSIAGGSVVNGIGEVMQGTWSWESPDTKLTSLGNKTYNATFTSS